MKKVVQNAVEAFFSIKLPAKGLDGLLRKTLDTLTFPHSSVLLTMVYSR